MRSFKLRVRLQEFVMKPEKNKKSQKSFMISLRNASQNKSS